MNSILLLGFHHGNEKLGEHLLRYMRKSRPDLLSRVDYKVANLRAKKLGVRYLESDMNRSYTGKSATYEMRRAARVLREIKAKDYGIVLDLHTTTCVQPPCFIVAETQTNRDFLMASSIEKVVVMQHEIVRSSLIGNFPRSVSIEINENEAAKERTLERLCDDIKRFIDGSSLGEPKEIYEVNGLLKKSEISLSDAATLRNFTRSPLGFYPILVGENSYKKQTHYLGFKAVNRRISKV